MAAGATYEPIATTTLGSAASSYTFSSIPGTYTDLIIVVNGTDSASGGNNWNLQFNGDTATNYSATRIRADGTTNDSARTTSATSILGIQMNDTLIGVQTYQIMNYANTTTYKTALLRGGVGGSTTATFLGAAVGLWRSTSAITSIKVLTNGLTSNFAVGTMFTLYGIAAA